MSRYRLDYNYKTVDTFEPLMGLLEVHSVSKADNISFNCKRKKCTEGPSTCHRDKKTFSNCKTRYAGSHNYTKPFTLGPSVVLTWFYLTWWLRRRGTHVGPTCQGDHVTTPS